MHRSGVYDTRHWKYTPSSLIDASASRPYKFIIRYWEIILSILSLVKLYINNHYTSQQPYRAASKGKAWDYTTHTPSSDLRQSSTSTEGPSQQVKEALVSSVLRVIPRGLQEEREFGSLAYGIPRFPGYFAIGPVYLKFEGRFSRQIAADIVDLVHSGFVEVSGSNTHHILFGSNMEKRDQERYVTLNIA